MTDKSETKCEISRKLKKRKKEKREQRVEFVFSIWQLGISQMDRNPKYRKYV